MQLRTFFLPVSVLTMTVVLSPANAQDYYVEGAVGVGTFETQNVLSEGSDDDFNLVGVRGGWNLNEYLAVEGEYFFGLSEHQQSYPIDAEPLEGLTSEASIGSVYGVYAKANLPIGDSLKLFTRVGIAGVETDYKGLYEDGEADDFTFTDEDYTAGLGIGASYEFTDRVYARVDATTYSLQWLDKQSVTIGAGIRF